MSQAAGNPTFRLLGTAAGGGLPQWNCGCSNCSRVRAGELPARSQSSAAFSPDGENWYLIDASPDVAQHLALLGVPQGRHSPLSGVLLTDAEFDHTLGLLQLREGSRWTLHATPGVHAILEDQFPLRRLLSRYAEITPRVAEPGEPQRFGALEVTWVALDDHTPRYHHGRRPAAGATSALRLRGPQRTLVYAPSLSTLDGPARELLASADIVLVDGTFYYPDELARLGLAGGDAASMGHLSMIESAPILATLTGTRLYTHLNNTNPALDPASPERAWIRSHGVDVADDGWLTGL